MSPCSSHDEHARFIEYHAFTAISMQGNYCHVCYPRASAAGIFIASLFIFVRPLAFSEGELVGLGVAVALLRLSPGVTAGARISSCANLVFATWSIVLAAALVGSVCAASVTEFINYPCMHALAQICSWCLYRWSMYTTG